LFNSAAKLQQEVEMWCGITAQAIEEIEHNPTSRAGYNRLYARYQVLQEARRLATELRVALYDSV
jgi:hypothetical protein